ncbi:uncharacterized protein KD926_008173 [Aspergillus affinis]|uniref:uncharacterized protein n=1 Tax=Aspergillus affinis TaxID=1070780 RepID=UPI0022FE3AAF|nr:HPC2-domain-containing protein [Aspergillus affinis]KAI9040468.1 HPC2-domain-containing protein [Aspergillus affinis]
MSPEPSVWPAQDDHRSRSLAAAQRPRRSRRKKDDEGDLDRKDTKATKSKEKEKEKDKDKEKEKEKEKDKDKSKEKDSNKENDKDKDGQEQKELKRGNRRQRDKSVSTPNAHSSNNSAAPSRKKPKLEETPPEQKPPVPVSTAPPAPIPAHTAAPAPPAPTTPAASPPAPPPVVSLHHHHHQPQPPSHLQQGPRHSMQSSASLPSSAHPTPPPPVQVQSISYHTMAPVGPPPRPQSQPPPPPPTRTSGQNFDPIRSAFDTATPAPPPVSTPVPSSVFSPSARPLSPRPPFRASASPAIASIIDPPTNSSPPLYAPRSYVSPGRGNSAYSPSPAATPAIAPTPPPLPPPQVRPVSPYANRSPYPPQPQPQPQQPSQRSPPSNPSPPAQPASVIPLPMPEPSQPASSNNQRAPSHEPTPMDVDADRSPPSAVVKAPKKESKAPPTAPPSDPTSPKPPRGAKEAPKPLPQGSGLISNALFGVGDGASDDPSSRRTPSIILHIPLQGNGDRIVNFARLAEEQYGFAALHPRLAAHKERLARVAAAGAALERNDKTGRGVSAGESADEDLSLEMDRDSDLEGESALGPSVARANGPEATEGKKKRRKKKMEEYDRDDPFVDDSELAWQEQAAASKDGFFVYSGPLVPEGEKVQVERYVILSLSDFVVTSRVMLICLSTAPMVQSNVAAAVDVEVADEARQPPSIKSLWRLPSPYRRKPVFLCAVLGREEAIRAVHGPKQLVNKRNRTNRAEMGLHRMVEAEESLAAEARRVLEEENRRR